jgi:hypothetical protein
VALGQGDQPFTQMGKVLLDREARDRPAFLPIPIPKMRTRPIATKELVLDMDGEIPHPTSDPEEVPIGDYGAVDLHHDRRRVAVFILEPPSQIEQDDGEILIDDHAGTQPVDTSGESSVGLAVARGCALR